MRFRSKTTSEVYKFRRKLVVKILSERRFCEACMVWAGFDIFNNKLETAIVNHQQATDVHEIINRSQNGSILDEKNLLAVCRTCHNRITVNPKDSEVLGLHLEGWCTDVKFFEEAARLRSCWSKGIQAKPFWFRAE